MTRRVGVEIEFAGLSARRAARALQASFGGSLIEEDAHAFEVSGSGIGDVAVELDIRHAHPQRHGAALALRPGRRLAAVFGSLASPFTPREMILTPRPAARFGEVERAVEVLRRAGARGDGRLWGQTLGLHLNVEAPRLDAAAICATALACARLDAELRDEIAEGDAALEARLPPPYSEAYVRRLRQGYAPAETAGFVEDYLAHNPTRDRALDLLPLLLHLDGPRVRRRLPYEKIAPRPVYHWRLPLARVGRPGWGVEADWRRWQRVEALAEQILAARA